MTAPSPGSVLVVDDNAALVDNLSEILDDAGYEVRGARSVSEARKAALDGFDVALVDVQLPDGDGLALAAELKAGRPTGEVVLLTGFASVESAAAAVRAGACAYLVKPCATPELLLSVGQAMRQVRLHDEKADLARRALRAEKLAAVGTLTAGLSHEIRNPLNAAGLQLSVLERRISKLGPELRAPLLEPLTLVRDEIRRLDHVLEDFLQFARPREFVAREVDLASLLNTTFQFLRGDAERRQLVLETSFEEVPKVEGEDGRLRQVFMNLALNAMEAAGPGGRVRASLRQVGGELEVAIEDSGPGIPADLRERIFEPFFTTKPSGSGLGLPIVNTIIQQHGGTVAAGESPLGGARFSIRLPVP